VPIYVAGSGPNAGAAGRARDGAIVYASTSPPILRAALGASRAFAGWPLARRRHRAVGADVHRATAPSRQTACGPRGLGAAHPLPVGYPRPTAAIARLRSAYDAFQHATAASRHRELVPDRFVDLMALAGTPAEIVEQVGRIAREVPEIGRIIILPQVPGDAYLGRDEILKMFAEEVMARV
jgi:alkanesulfonate monooxygenase SsuD/methylene tetrahydromethanopterin reductase-like flavin-dependent oxidoreductase (luciferase family)